MMPIMNVFNEWHSANTSKKIRTVFISKAKAGEFKATYIPYGYLKGDGNVPLVIDEEVAPVVRKIFDMRACGMGKQHIATVLTQEGIPTPSERRNRTFGVLPVNKNRRGWSSQTIKEMLVNPVYIGNLAQQRTTTISYKNKKLVKRPESEWIIKEHTHEAIITDVVWKKCREIDASVSHGKSTNQGVVRPLSGLVYCPECGAKMRLMYYNSHRKGEQTVERRSAFNCSEFLSHGKINCGSKAIKEQTLNEIVLQDILSKAQMVVVDENEARTAFLKRKTQCVNNQANVDTKHLKAMTKRLADLSALTQSIYEDKVAGKIPEEICVELLQKYQTEKVALTEEVSELQKRLNETQQINEDVDEFVRRIKQYSELTELDRATTMDLIEYITIGRVPKDKTIPREIHIYYKLLDKPKTK
jgi:hypothetical protein